MIDNRAECSAEIGQAAASLGSVLFCCSMNSIRSPIAEGLLKSLLGTSVYVDSCGAREGNLDGFMVEVMAELGIDMAGHVPKTFDDLLDDNYDVLIALSREAYEQAKKEFPYSDMEILHWQIADPSLARGSRDLRLLEYRAARDDLHRRIQAYFTQQIMSKEMMDLVDYG